jgi:hypothetical protein
MVSPYKASFNLRENMIPCLESCIRLYNGLRDSERTSQRLPRLARVATSPKDEADHLIHSASVRDTAKSGIGCAGNRHLTYLAESIFVNVGGCYRDAKVSSPPMLDSSVGAAIVVRAWESQAQGEGPQSVGISRAKLAG